MNRKYIILFTLIFFIALSLTYIVINFFDKYKDFKEENKALPSRDVVGDRYSRTLNLKSDKSKKDSLNGNNFNKIKISEPLINPDDTLNVKMYGVSADGNT